MINGREFCAGGVPKRRNYWVAIFGYLEKYILVFCGKCKICRRLEVGGVDSNWAWTLRRV